MQARFTAAHASEHMPRLPVLGRNEAIKFNQIFSYKVH